MVRDAVVFEDITEVSEFGDDVVCDVAHVLLVVQSDDLDRRHVTGILRGQNRVNHESHE